MNLFLKSMLHNKSAEMEIFVRVYETGGFSAAARSLGLTPSAVAKAIQRLEARLGATLFQRSTRSLRPSEEGEFYYERARAILTEIDAVDASLGEHAVAARGLIRVNTTVPFGTHVLLPIIRRFQTAHPEVTLDLTFTESVVDLLAERTDVAIRVGPLKDSRLMKRRIGASPLLYVASPRYLETAPPLRRPEDLARHNCLHFNFRRNVGEWTLFDRPENRSEKGTRKIFAAPGKLLVSSGETMRDLLLAGHGIGRLAGYHVAKDLKAGRLVPVLPQYDPRDLEEVHAVFLSGGGLSGGSRFSLPARTRLFIDFVAAQAATCMSPDI